MIRLTFDAVLQAVSIERGGRQHVYTPSPASIRRALLLTCQATWLYRPSNQPRVFVWECAQHA
jgi:hypothetical protein